MSRVGLEKGIELTVIKNTNEFCKTKFNCIFLLISVRFSDEVRALVGLD